MATEIERKFLVDIKALPQLDNGEYITQGYIPTLGEISVRVRLSGRKAFLTLKTSSQGLSRSEYEYEIPAEDAREIIAMFCSRRLVAKNRYRVPHGRHIWEIDVFKGENEGLVIAEVELEHEQDSIELPEWVTREVTGDARYYNQNLAENPHTNW